MGWSPFCQQPDSKTTNHNRCCIWAGSQASCGGGGGGGYDGAFAGVPVAVVVATVMLVVLAVAVVDVTVAGWLLMLLLLDGC